MLLLTTYYTILLCFNELAVGSNVIFCCYFLTTLLFFTSKIMLHRCFLYHFSVNFCSKIEKNLPIFCNFFSLCINDLRKS